MEKFKTIFKNNEMYLFLFIILLYTIWKFYAAFEVGVSVSYPYGDGLGTIGSFGEVVEQIKVKNFSYLLSDLTPVELIGNGVHGSAPINALQKIIIGSLSLVAIEDNIYDLYAMLGFILVGIATFLLLKEIGTLSIFACIGALMMMNNDNYVRYTGHLQLAIPFMSIFLTLFIFKLSKATSYTNMILVVVMTVLNFMMNEYYGYYGIFYTIFLFLGLLTYYQFDSLKTKYFWIEFLKKLSTGILLLIIMMSLAYPNLIFQKLVSLFINIDTSVGNSFGSRSFDDFIVYSIKNSLYYFYPKIGLLQSILPSDIFTKNTFWEQSFRLGLVLPIFFVLAYLYILLKRDVINYIGNKNMWFVLALLPAIMIMILFSNDPNYGPSLVKLSYKISEVFRVSSRAYLYILILSIVIFFFYFNHLWNFLTKNQIINRTLLYVTTAILFIIALYDVTGKIWYTQFDTYKLPKNDIYSYLGTLPKGLVCEVPFYSSKNDVPESSYIYTYNRSIYKAHLLNAQVQQSSKYYDTFNALSKLMKYPDDSLVNILRELGVRYIVVDKNKSTWNLEKINDYITLLQSNDEKSLYQINQFIIKTPNETRDLLIQKSEELEKKVLQKRMNLAPILKIDELINFKSKDSQKFLLSGFSNTEDWGTWSDGNKAIIIFTADNELLSNGKYIKIVFNIFGDAEHEQNIKIKLNNIVIYENKYLAEKNIILNIPISNDLSKENLLSIESPNAISPRELKMGNDVRKLSIGIINISVVSNQKGDR